MTPEFATTSDHAARAAQADRATPGDAPTALPEWFTNLLLVGLLGVAALGSSGLVLAMLGVFEPVAVAVAGLLTTAGALALWYQKGERAPRPSGRGPATTKIVVAVLVGVLAITALNVRFSGQHLVTNRDAGSYNVTAALLAEEGDLLFESRQGPFGDHPELRHTGFAFYDTRDDHQLYAQFFHLLPVLLAVGLWLGGFTLMFKVNAVLGGLALLTVFAFASRCMRAWPAALATGALAITVPQVWFSRDSYTEILSQALLFGGLWLFLMARESWSRRRGFVAGAVLGMIAMTRIDGFIILVPLIAYAVAEWYLSADDDRRRIRRTFMVSAVTGALLTAGLGLLDGRWYSPIYLRDLESSVTDLGLVVGAVLAGGIAVAALRQPIRALGRRWIHLKRPLAWFAAVGVVLAAALAALRPLFQTVRNRPNALVEALQLRDGLPIEPARTYAEFSFHWMGWYLGPFLLAAAVVGLAALVWRLVRTPSATSILVISAFVVPTVVYLWRPSIIPDHLWAMRRFLPVTLPGLVLLGFWAFGEGWRQHWPKRRLGHLVRPTIGAAVAVTFVFLSVALWPLRTAREEVPMLDLIDDTCERIGDAAVVVLDGDNLGNAWPQAVRAWCDVPTARAPADLGPTFFRRLARDWQAAGRDLVLLHAAAVPFDSEGDVYTEFVSEITIHQPEQTLDHRPDRIIGVPVIVFASWPGADGPQDVPGLSSASRNSS